MPRCATAFNFVIPTGADLDFLHRGTAQSNVCGFLQRKPHEVGQGHYAGQEIRGSVGEGPAVSFGPHANADEGQLTNPILFEIHPFPYNQRITCTPNLIYRLIWTALAESSPGRQSWVYLDRT
jgi:hypothetical protein